MRKLFVATAVIASLLLLARQMAPALFAAEPASTTISPAAPRATWSGGPFLVSNPASCSLAPATCDRFAFTVQPPDSDFVVTIRITGRDVSDDLDLFIRDAAGATIARSATETGVEEITLVNPAAGTYTAVVQPFLVKPAPVGAGGAYDGLVAIGSPSLDELSNAYRAAIFGPDFAGVPQSQPARASHLLSRLKVSVSYVGRPAAEPTIGVNANNTAFFAAGAFDSIVGVSGVARLARTVVMRSKDKGRTWQPASPPFALSETSTTEPVFSLDPMIHVDPVTGRVFSVDLFAGCSHAIFSDDEGATWQRNVLACGQPVNDHHTIMTAPPPPGLTTLGYPNMLYYCFNRVGDSSCGRSHDGGMSFVPAGSPAFTGVDPETAGGVCGGLHGHLGADAVGRIFLPKGHCSLPWVAISGNGGETWTRVNISKYTPMDDHEVSVAVDTADNVYAVWADRTFRLPFLSVSRDHGASWSTPIMMAPPGVHEVNFPTIVAGDPGRIAVLFPGSESTDFSDATRPWNIYVVMSVTALASDPLFTWTSANDGKDPVHRGSCGPGRCDAEDGGSMFDFLDIQLSPADGAFWGTASDTCVANDDPARNCVTNPQAQKLRPGQGVAIRQVKGPSLFVDGPR